MKGQKIVSKLESGTGWLRDVNSFDAQRSTNAMLGPTLISTFDSVYVFLHLCTASVSRVSHKIHSKIKNISRLTIKGNIT